MNAAWLVPRPDMDIGIRFTRIIIGSAITINSKGTFNVSDKDNRYNIKAFKNHMINVYIAQLTYVFSFIDFKPL